MFNIYDTESGELLTIGHDEPIVFDSGRVAADYCKAYSGHRKLQPRKAAKGDDDWREREYQRIRNGQYKRPSYLDDLERDSDHYLHLAEKRPGQLAYTKDEAKGRQDAQSIISLQGYIEAFCQDMLPRHLDEIRAEHEGRALEDDGLKFASTPDEIVKVYTNYDCDSRKVSCSCMRHERDDYEGDIPHHPAYVYGAGDLAVAYTVNGEGETTARALCWPDKKVYSRVYDDADDRLHRLLRRRGYVKSCAYYNDGSQDHDLSLLGARLLRIEHPYRDDAFLVPYCDETDQASDDGKYLRLVRCGGRVDLHVYTGDHNYAWSDGHGAEDDDDDRETCERCDARCDTTYSVYVSRRHAESWCEHCESSYSFCCEWTGDSYSDTSVEMVDVNGQTWSTYAFEEHGDQCARTGDNFAAEDLAEVVVDEDGSTELWGPRSVDRHTWECEKSYVRVSEDVDPQIVTIDGIEQDWAPHIAASHARGQALAVYRRPYRPRLTLRGDDPGQLQLPHVIYMPPVSYDIHGRDQYGEFRSIAA